MRKIISFVIAILLGVSMYYLYQRQLGAISFFFLSIFFFILGFKQLRKSGKQEKRAK